MIKAVVFDFDNTLMDFMRVKRNAVEAAVDAMTDAGLKMPKERMIEKIYRAYWKEGIEDQNVFDKVLTQEFGKIDYRILAAGILGYRRAKDGAMAVYPHVHMALTGLVKMGIRMAIVSDAPKLPVWMRIVAMGLQHYFDDVITFDDTGERKPSPKPFLKALEVLQAKPGEAIMIGDWAERDMVGAKRVGMRTCFARYGDEFGTKISGADYEIDDILELLDIVKRENEGGQLGLFDKGLKKGKGR
jgi:HAD superfamily hydrolase (TIGR02253 family)